MKYTQYVKRSQKLLSLGRGVPPLCLVKAVRKRNSSADLFFDLASSCVLLSERYENALKLVAQSWHKTVH